MEQRYEKIFVVGLMVALVLSIIINISYSSLMNQRNTASLQRYAALILTYGLDTGSRVNAQVVPIPEPEYSLAQPDFMLLNQGAPVAWMTVMNQRECTADDCLNPSRTDCFAYPAGEYVGLNSFVCACRIGRECKNDFIIDMESPGPSANYDFGPDYESYADTEVLAIISATDQALVKVMTETAFFVDHGAVGYNIQTGISRVREISGSPVSEFRILVDLGGKPFVVDGVSAGYIENDTTTKVQ